MFAERFSFAWLNRKTTQKTIFGALMSFFKKQITNTKSGRAALELFGQTPLR